MFDDWRRKKELKAKRQEALEEFIRGQCKKYRFEGVDCFDCKDMNCPIKNKKKMKKLKKEASLKGV